MMDAIRFDRYLIRGRDRERREERERRKVAIIGIPTMYLTILTKVEWNDGRTAHTGP